MKLTFEVQINLNLQGSYLEIDFMEKTLHKPKNFLSFKKASESNQIKLKWTENLKKHQADGYLK